MQSESISAFDKAGDVLTPYLSVPSSSEGELGDPAVNAQVADLNQKGSTETRDPFTGVAAK